MEELNQPWRLNKFLAHAGLGTRKQAVDHVKKGEIKINDIVELNPFYEVKDGDIVTYKGKILQPKRHNVYVLINKGKSCPIYRNEGQVGLSVQDLIKKFSDVSAKPVVDFDDNMSGLMVWTNDDDLVVKLSAEHKLKSVYEIETEIGLTQEDINDLQVKLSSETILVKAFGFVDTNDFRRIGIEVIGGKPTEIAHVFYNKGIKLIKFDCTFFSGLTKKDLKRGWSRFLTEKETIFLKHFS